MSGILLTCGHINTSTWCDICNQRNPFMTPEMLRVLDERQASDQRPSRTHP